MSQQPQRLLIVKPSALGDVIQALPVATSVKAAWPHTEIHWIINDSFAPVLEGHDAIDHLVHYPRKRWNSPAAIPEILRLRKQLQTAGYELTIDLQGLLRSGLMTWASGAPRRLGLASAREGSHIFYNETIRDDAPAAAERYLQVLDYLNIARRPHDFGLNPQTDPPESLGDTRNFIALHPYSTWRTKLWPWRYFQTLVDSLPDEQFVVVGRGDWFPLLGNNLIDLRGETSLDQLVTVLSRARVVVSTDSGPAHIAGALNRPTIALFGATDWRKTKPVGQYITVLNESLPCAPCLKRRCTHASPLACMQKISPAIVAETINNVLAELPAV